MTSDSGTQFICGFLLILGAAVFYVLWDNSVKKFDEVVEKIDLCMEPLYGWMVTTESLLEKYIKTDKDREYFAQIVKFRKIYECRLNSLKDFLKLP